MNNNHNYSRFLGSECTNPVHCLTLESIYLIPCKWDGMLCITSAISCTTVLHFGLALQCRLF